VSTDQPLVRFGADRAVIRAVVARDGRDTLIELELNPGRANRARLNRSPLPRPREVLGTLRSVLFAPEDLVLVKGDPAGRRAFLDDLLVQRQPRWAGVRADYDKVLKQRSALLKSAAPVLRRGSRRRYERFTGYGEPVEDARASALHTLDVWDSQLARFGAQLLHGRLRLVADLRPHLVEAYAAVSAAPADARMTYRSSLRAEAAAALSDVMLSDAMLSDVMLSDVMLAAGELPEIELLEKELLASLTEVREQEVERGICLVGPHRDDLLLALGELPAKGYASHGESWSFALGLKLAAYQLLRSDLGQDPVLVLDDVFAELDTGRRERLAHLVEGCEQVLITAAVDADVPAALRSAGTTYTVSLGEVSRVA
jgi:DNA replication and repair protein RecF